MLLVYEGHLEGISNFQHHQHAFQVRKDKKEEQNVEIKCEDYGSNNEGIKLDLKLNDEQKKSILISENSMEQDEEDSYLEVSKGFNFIL